MLQLEGHGRGDYGDMIARLIEPCNCRVGVRKLPLGENKHPSQRSSAQIGVGWGKGVSLVGCRLLEKSVDWKEWAGSGPGPFRKEYPLLLTQGATLSTEGLLTSRLGGGPFFSAYGEPAQNSRVDLLRIQIKIRHFHACRRATLQIEVLDLVFLNSTWGRSYVSDYWRSRTQQSAHLGGIGLRS